MRTYSLRTRLALINAVMVLAVVAISSAAAWWTTRAVIERSLMAEMHREADRMVGRLQGRPQGMNDRQPPGPPPSNDPLRPVRFDREGRPDSGDSGPANPGAFHQALRTGRAEARMGNDRLFLYVRIPDGAVQLQRPLEPTRAFLTNQAVALGSLLPVALILAALTGAYLSHLALRPVNRQASLVEKLDGQDPTVRLERPPEAEFGRWTDQFNLLLQRFQNVFDQREALLVNVQAAKESQSKFIADASHELRTPLTRLRLATGVVGAPNLTEGELLENLKIADDAARELHAIVEELTLLIQSDARQWSAGDTRVDLREAAVRAIQASAPAQGPDPTIDPSLTGALAIDPEHLHRILLNLLTNSRRHTPPDRAITISRAGSEILVTDEGPGVSAEALAHLGERFFRSDEARSRETGGLGLGLSIVRALMDVYGGKVVFESHDGLIVRLQFPQSRWKDAPI